MQSALETDREGVLGMDAKPDRKLLVTIAQMYYEDNMTQSEIAQRLGIYRTTISRLLKRVREEGIVKITINYEAGGTSGLERRLVERFGLKEAVVVPAPSSDTGARVRALGEACGQSVARLARKDEVIGFSWGSAMSMVAGSLPYAGRPFVTFVPMVGGPAGTLDSEYHVNTICYQAAARWGARSRMIDLPAVSERDEMRKLWAESRHYREISGLWDRLGIAVFGIGALRQRGRKEWQAFYGEEAIRELVDGRAAGDICSRFFDQEGNRVRTVLDDRLLTIMPEQLSRARYTIGVAESPEKAEGILGALRSGWMNMLVTTEETAQMILDMEIVD